MKNTLLCSLCLLLSVSIVQAQNVGIGTNTPQQALDVDGWIEVGDQTQGAGGTAGTIRFNTTDGGFMEYYDGTAWQRIGQRILRGTIDSDAGTITAGSGFTLTKNAVGDNTITFNTAFATPPTVVATPVTAPTPPVVATYCPISYTNCGPGADDWITNVTFGAINNTTADEGCPDSYDDFTSQTTTVTAGTNVPISVSFFSDGTWTEYVTVFIDWNQDGDFQDASEEYQLGFGIDATIAGNIAVPATAFNGPTRMRVIEDFNAYAADACNTVGSAFGGVEDYTVNVTGGVAAPSVNSGALIFITNTTTTECDVEMFDLSNTSADLEYNFVVVGE